jgi:hypothetical protein
MKIRAVGTELFDTDRRSVRRTDMKNIIVAFRSVANAPKNRKLYYFVH